jgi:hypothetical protein
MPTKYVIPTISGDHRYVEPTNVLTTKVTKLEKLQYNKLEAQNNVEAYQWNIFVESTKKHKEEIPIWR